MPEAAGPQRFFPFLSVAGASFSGHLPVILTTAGNIASCIVILCIAQALPYDLGEYLGVRFRRWVMRHPFLYRGWTAVVQWLTERRRLVGLGDFILREHVRLNSYLYMDQAE